MLVYIFKELIQTDANINAAGTQSKRTLHNYINDIKK